MRKDELLRLLTDEDVSAAIFDIVKRGAAREALAKKTGATGAPKTPAIAPPATKPALKPMVDAKQRKADIEAEKKSALSFGAIEKLRARVAKATEEKLAAQAPKSEPYTPPSGELDVAEDDVLGFATETAYDEPPEEKLLDSDSDAVSPKATEEDANEDFEEKLSLLRQHVSAKQGESPKTAALQKPAKTEEDYRFIVERTCPVCGRQTRAVKVKSRLPVIRRDIDLCVHYQGINPYLYSVISCEHCGFAAEEKKFLAHMGDKTKAGLFEFLSQNDMKLEFHENRSVKEGVAATEMAILFSELTDKSPSRQAGLYLTGAWIYRYAKIKEKEKRRLEKAAQLYERALVTERTFAGNISGNTIMYLIGALYFETENYEKSTSFLSRIIGDQNLRMQDPKTYDRARDLWQDIRAMKRIGVGDG